MTIPLIRENLPDDLRALPQWVVWKIQTRHGKPTKVPFCARGGEGDATDAATWSTFEQALAAYDVGGWDGIGFVFSPDDPFAGVDLDKCRNAETGVIEPWAQDYLDRLASYAEVSPSGTGVKVIVRASHPGYGFRKAYPDGHGCEMYDAARYFTLTGQSLDMPPSPIMAGGEAFDTIHREIFGAKAPAAPRPSARPALTVLPDDHDLLEKARGGANGAAFSALYDGGAGGYGSGSEADLALCGMLAFWTGGDTYRMDRLFRGSALFREKWDERRGQLTYGQKTINRSLDGRTEFYSPGQPVTIRKARPGAAAAFGQASSSPGAPARPIPPPSAPGDEWDAPMPFGGEKLPAFPLQALPSPLREYVAEVAASRQVPIDMAAMMGLTVVSAAAARRCEIKVGETHTETLNGYHAVVMQPGSRKSGTLEDFAQPLREHELRETQSHFSEWSIAKEKHKQQNARLEALRMRIARSKDEIERRALEDESEHLAGEITEVEELPRLLADDVTMERLAGLLAEQEDNCITIMSAEGGIFALAAGRYNNGAVNLDLLLKGHGGETYRVDRVGQPPKHVRRATITLGLAVQPDVLQSLSDNKSFRGQGLLARFLYSVPENLVGTRLYENRAIDPAMRARYNDLVDRLLSLPPLSTRENPGLRHTLRIDDAALKIWTRYYNDVELKQAEGQPYHGIADWASKLAGAVARIAGNLHLVKHFEKRAPWTEPVDIETMAAAWAIGEYLIPHALTAFSQIGTDESHVFAQRILKWMPDFARREEKTTFSVRDCHRDLCRNKTPEEITIALATLCERGYARLQEVEPTGRSGRRPSPVYAIHPDLLREEETPAADVREGRFGRKF